LENEKFRYICEVKKIIAIIILFSFLSANTAFGQIMRLPNLINHYFEHNESNDISLFDFLSEHYAKTINHSDDKQSDHKKLPFKTIDWHSAQIVSLKPHPNFAIPLIIPEVIEINKSSHQKNYYLNAFLNSIWQPPRFS